MALGIGIALILVGTHSFVCINNKQYENKSEKIINTMNSFIFFEKIGIKMANGINNVIDELNFTEFLQKRKGD